MFEQSIVLSEVDFARLNKLLIEKADDEFDDVLQQADITNCACIPFDLVTMNSKISYLRLSDQKVSELTIVYPEYADISKHFVSVLSPLGRAFIGHHKGETVECVLPSGETSRLKILEVLYQPEAKGDYHL